MSASGRGDASGAIDAQPSSFPLASSPGANLPASVTFPGVAGKRVRITFVVFVLGGAGGGAQTGNITDGVTSLDLIVAGPGPTVVSPVYPVGGVAFGVGLPVTVSLPAAGAGSFVRIQAAAITA